MATLGTEYIWVGDSYMGKSYVNYYQTVYAKYSRTEAQRLARKSTLWVKVIARNVGTSQHAAWGTWVGRVTGTITSSYSVNGTVTGAAALTVYEGSVEVSHDASGNCTVYVGADSMDGPLQHTPSGITTVTYTLPRIILNPSISINGAGSSSSNRLNMSGNTTMSITLGNTDGKATSVYLNGSLIGAHSTNGTFNDPVVQTLWNNYPNNSDLNLTLTASNSNGSSSTTAYLHLNDSVKPSISSVTLSGTNSITSLGSTYVKGLTIPKIITNASGVLGSSISKYELISLTGFEGTLPKQITQTFDGTKPFNDLSVSAKVRVYDTRNHYIEQTSNTLTIVDYSEPSLSVTGQRCTSSGTIKDDGTYIKLTINYSVSPINNGSTNLNTKTLEYSKDGTNWTSISISSWSGTKTQIVGTYSTTTSSQIYVRLRDIAKENNSIVQVTPAFTTASFHTGGKGVTLGQVATQDEFHSYMEAHFHDGIYIGNTLVLYDDGN